jgi:hemin uptake protein HemP
MNEANEPPTRKIPPASCEAPILLDARLLFQGRKEVWIDHDGVRYRLRVTRRNKLILQK